MDEAKKKESWWGFGLYWGLVFTALRLLLSDGFSVSVPIALGVSTLVTALIGYPFFVRGTVNRWRRGGGQWEMWQWVVLSVVFAIMGYLVASYFRWE